MQRLIIRNIVSVLIFLLAVIILNRYDMFTVYTVVILFTIEVLYNIFSSYFFVIKPIEKMIKLVEETDWESDDIDFDKFDKLNSSSIFHLDVLIKNYQYLVDIIENKIDVVHDLNYLSEHDELTGCYNRVKLDKMIPKYESLHSMVVIFIDVNNLKLMNDTNGHDAGDALLKRTAKALSYWVVYGEVYRIGGDEFMVVVPDKKLTEVQPIIDRWYSTVGSLNREDDTFECRLAYGVSEGNQNTSFDYVMAQADNNMYTMKKELKRYRERVLL